MTGQWGSLTSSREGRAEDPLDGFAGTAVTPADSALVFPQVGAQDPVTTHMLGRAVVVGVSVRGHSPAPPSRLSGSPLHLALAADTNVHRVRAAGCPIHHGCRPLRVEVETFC